jgi:hypothetical protein
LTRSVIVVSSVRDSPVSAGWARWSDTREHGGSGSPLDTNSINALAVVNRSVVGPIVRWCSCSSRQVSAIAWPMEFVLIPSSSDSTFWEQIWRRHISLPLARIRSDANSQQCAARGAPAEEIMPLNCGSAPVTEMMMTYHSTRLVDHWPLPRMVDLLRC